MESYFLTVLEVRKSKNKVLDSEVSLPGLQVTTFPPSSHGLSLSLLCLLPVL